MLAAIDVGSNTLRLLIGEVSTGKVLPSSYHRKICRLAGGFTVSEGLSVASRRRTLSALHEFAQICKQLNIDQINAVGTAAFRMAANSSEFVEQIHQETGIPLQIISGEQEAELMASGVLSALDPRPEQSLIVDIGGGSTEFVLTNGSRVVWSASYPFGVVRLTEDHPDNVERRGVISKQLKKVKTDIARACRDKGVNHEDIVLVGTAGTVTTIAALDLAMDNYDWRRINNYQMSLSGVKRWYAKLTPMSATQRELLAGMEAGRGDLILAGIEIIHSLMPLLDLDLLTVSDFGILEGLLLEQ